MSEQIHSCMAKIQKEFPYVGKGQKNPSQGYNYRGIDDALAALSPLLAKHGVYMVIEQMDAVFSDGGQTKSGKKQNRCMVTGAAAFVCGEDGSRVSCALAGEGLDMGDKALMKAQANALKYLIWYSFCVPTWEVRDSEAFADEPAPAKKPPPPPKSKGRTATAPAGPSALSATTTVYTGSGDVGALVKKLRAVKKLASLEKLKPACKELVGGLSESNPDRVLLLNAYRAQQEKLGA